MWEEVQQQCKWLHSAATSLSPQLYCPPWANTSAYGFLQMMDRYLWTRLRKKAGEIFRIVAKLGQRPFPWKWRGRIGKKIGKKVTRIRNGFSFFWFSPSADCLPVMLCGGWGHLELHSSWIRKTTFLLSFITRFNLVTPWLSFPSLTCKIHCSTCRLMSWWLSQQN